MTGQQGQSQVLIIDGKSQRLTGQSGAQAESMKWSADGSRTGYLMNNQEVVIDGQPTGVAGTFAFSPDGKHVLVAGKRPELPLYFEVANSH